MDSCCSCCDASHALKFSKPSRVPPDPELFPRYFQNTQGLWLRFAEWEPPREVPAVRAVLFLVSGVAEHTARYDPVALTFAREGYHVFCMDNQGAGGSEGKRLMWNTSTISWMTSCCLIKSYFPVTRAMQSCHTFSWDTYGRPHSSARGVP
ncbi:putative monoglyceride lipase [Trypanosoma cruzi]|uniref:Putative monoglyceride lipase n=1 Tax=Trypanosoma cruzi TaxID=5693 RepID=A0A2V2UUN2_TRYCR|nr:putative monoglyceride lipase [Trypanosoma cruzi]